MRGRAAICTAVGFEKCCLERLASSLASREKEACSFEKEGKRGRETGSVWIRWCFFRRWN
jgi:hypothetical protein